MAAALLAVGVHVALLVAMIPTREPEMSDTPAIDVGLFHMPESLREPPPPRLRDRPRIAKAAVSGPVSPPLVEVPASPVAQAPAPFYAPPAAQRAPMPPALYPPSQGRMAGCIDAATGRQKPSCDRGPTVFGPPAPSLAAIPRAREFEAGYAQKHGGPVDLGGNVTLRQPNGRRVGLTEQRCQGDNFGMNCLEESAVGIISQKF